MPKSVGAGRGSRGRGPGDPALPVRPSEPLGSWPPRLPSPLTMLPGAGASPAPPSFWEPQVCLSRVCVQLVTAFVSFSPHSPKYLSSTFKEDSFILTHAFRGVSPRADGPIALAGGEAEHHGRQVWQRNAAQPLAARKQSEKGRGQARDRPCRAPTSSKWLSSSGFPPPPHSPLKLFIHQIDESTGALRVLAVQPVHRSPTSGGCCSGDPACSLADLGTLPI